MWSNGPGESADADIGLSGGRGKGVIYKKGQYHKTVPEDQFLDAVLQEVAAILPEHEARLVYPGAGELGPVSAGRTRKGGIPTQTAEAMAAASASPKTHGIPLNVVAPDPKAE